jgi:hypothetical protein
MALSRGVRLEQLDVSEKYDLGAFKEYELRFGNRFFEHTHARTKIYRYKGENKLTRCSSCSPIALCKRIFRRIPNAWKSICKATRVRVGVHREVYRFSYHPNNRLRKIIDDKLI